MRLLALTSFIALTLVNTASYAKKPTKKEREIMFSAFQTGCTSGIIAVMDAGFYDKGSIDGKEAYMRMQKECTNQLQWYRNFIGEGDE